jgi:hypothetical protein
MRGWVYHLQLLLSPASTVILRSESHGTHDPALLSQIQDLLFITSCNLQVYSGWIWPHLHTEKWQPLLESESESELLYDWLFTANQFILAPSPLRLTARILFSQLNTCGHSPSITYSLAIGWVCHLQLLLALTSAFILGSESRGNILLSQIRDFPFCRLLWLAGLQWRYSTPPPHRIDRVRVTLRLAVYRWSVRLGAEPLETHDQNFLSSENLRSESLCNILSAESMSLSFKIVAGPRQHIHSQVRVDRTHDHTLLSQIRHSPNLEPRSPYLYTPGTGWPSYTFRHWVPFLLPFMTHRATVEVIRTLLHTLEGQSAMTWRINSRRTEYKT